MSKTKEETKEKLKNALIEILIQQDMIDVTVSDVVKKAGLNRSAFYVYYKNIGEILDDIVEENLGRIPVVTQVEKDDFQEVIRYVIEHRKVFYVLLRTGKYEEYIMKKIYQHTPEDESYLIYYLLTSFFFSGFQNYLLFAIQHKDDFSVKELADIAWILSRETKKLIDQNEIRQ